MQYYKKKLTSKWILTNSKKKKKKQEESSVSVVFNKKELFHTQNRILFDFRTVLIEKHWYSTHTHITIAMPRTFSYLNQNNANIIQHRQINKISLPNFLVTQNWQVYSTNKVQNFWTDSLNFVTYK